MFSFRPPALMALCLQPCSYLHLATARPCPTSCRCHLADCPRSLSPHHRLFALPHCSPLALVPCATPRSLPPRCCYFAPDSLLHAGMLLSLLPLVLSRALYCLLTLVLASDLNGTIDRSRYVSRSSSPRLQLHESARSSLAATAASHCHTLLELSRARCFVAVV